MSYKIGLILSSIFIAIFFAFGVDLMTIQFAYSDLDSKSTAISYKISQHGSMEPDFVTSLEEQYKVSIQCVSYCTPLFGDVVDYILSKEITTLVVSKGPMNIAIERSAVIGFFG